ncbi:hypothetical protein E2C01_071150 [Portunus trituberculatus]|uniref:Uncharacterized protein n=1 Tax=Portunus trituberculatus TaxID=210409 RepID=A0A5B7I3I6_PORTR|nr:hypothetical protein [Portunus trituberculatus]
MDNLPDCVVTPLLARIHERGDAFARARDGFGGLFTPTHTPARHLHAHARHRRSHGRSGEEWCCG